MTMIDLWETFYSWASAQPIFIQVALGIALFLGGLYFLGWIIGILFLNALRLSDKRKSERNKIQGK